MYQPNRLLERELAFTACYRENQDAPKALRESRCMEEQLSTYFIAPRQEDLIAGRIDRPYVVFAPCLEGDGIDKVGYCIDEANCRRLAEEIRADASYDGEYLRRVEEMIAFWKEENTNTKIRRRFPPFWEGSMGGDDYFAVNAPIHPLYRLAGVNLDFRKLFSLGLAGLKGEALSRAASAAQEQKPFYEGIAHVLDAIRKVILAYREEALRLGREASGTGQAHWREMADTLLAIADAPPATMRQAIQLQCIYMLSARCVEIGRIDDYMGEFYVRDLAQGRLTREEAAALLNDFFSIIETQCGRDTRVIVGGLGREDAESADAFAMLVMDVLELRKDRFYPQISLRYSREMDQAVYDRALRILSEGSTYPMLYCDDVNIPSVMQAMDVPRSLAQQYSFFGCGEYMLAYHSIGTPNTALNVAKVLELVLHEGINPATGRPCGPKAAGIPVRGLSEISCFEDLMELLMEYLAFFIDLSGGFEELLYQVCNEEACFLQYSALLCDCMGKGRAMLDGGLTHLGGTVETYGNVTLADSMAAIKYVVYDEQAFSLERLVEVLSRNFEGCEEEHRLLLSAPKFGNDHEEADGIARRLHEFICRTIRAQREKRCMDSFLAVLINNNMNVSLGRFVGATPDGRKAAEFLSNGNSPYNGQDREGLTAMLCSMCKMDTAIHAGGNQNLKVSRRMFAGEEPLIKPLLAAFFSMGGQQLNLSVVDQEDLEDAMEHPERHENLVVRVGGFTARFIDLDRKTQQDVLSRTAY